MATLGLHQGEPFTLSDNDRRQHFYQIGATGVGKSGLLENMIAGDLEEGSPVIVIDPHGSLATKLADRIPAQRAQQLRYIDLSDRSRSVALPFITGARTNDERSVVTENAVAAFVHTWDDTAIGDRSQDVLRYSIRAAMEVDGTLLTVRRMLSDATYREDIVRRLQHPKADPLARLFWLRDFPEEDERRREDWISPIRNKLNATLTPPLLRILSQRKPSFDIQTIMDERQILIVNLAIGSVGEIPARIFGSLLVSAITQAAFKRGPRSPICFMYVDEFQKVITPAFTTILAEARKYNLALILANQTLSALPHGLASSILANVGGVMAFRCGREDAEIMQKHMASDRLQNPEMIQGLPNFEAYGRFVQNGKTTDALRIATLPPPKAISKGRNLIQNSVLKFGKDRAEIEENIRGFLG